MKLKTGTKGISGKVSLLDLLIVILAIVLIHQVYTRGRVDKYLPEEYRYAVRFAPEGMVAVDQSDSTTPPATTTTAPAAATTTAAAAAPATATVTTPASTPAATRANPPAPAAAAPAAATAAQQTLKELRATPRHRWPKQIAIRREMEVPIVSNGRIAGSMKAQPGTMFELIDIQENAVHLRIGNEVKALPPGETDVFVRFLQISR